MGGNERVGARYSGDGGVEDRTAESAVAPVRYPQTPYACKAYAGVETVCPRSPAEAIRTTR
jgi:hypothetical protein